MRLEHLLSGDGTSCHVLYLTEAKGALKSLGPGSVPLPLVCLFAVYGGLAQLARAPALQAGGQRFESVILHVYEIFDILTHKTVSKDFFLESELSRLIKSQQYS